MLQVSLHPILNWIYILPGTRVLSVETETLEAIFCWLFRSPPGRWRRASVEFYGCTCVGPNPLRFMFPILHFMSAYKSVHYVFPPANKGLNFDTDNDYELE